MSDIILASGDIKSMLNGSQPEVEMDDGTESSTQSDSSSDQSDVCSDQSEYAEDHGHVETSGTEDDGTDSVEIDEAELDSIRNDQGLDQGLNQHFDVSDESSISYSCGMSESCPTESFPTESCLKWDIDSMDFILDDRRNSDI